MTAATISIVGRRLPGRRFDQHANVHLGVQHRTEAVDLVPADAHRAIFTVPVEVHAGPDGVVDFRGPFVQGRPGARFIYLSWGELTGNRQFTMFRRAKLALGTVPAHVTQALLDGRTVAAELDLTDARGGPLCATIPADWIRWA